MIRMTLYVCAALATCAMLSACKPTWHDIRLTPDGAVMEREISQQFGPEELERVTLLYGQEVGEETLAKFEKLSSVDTVLQAEWDAFIEDLRPGTDLGPTLRNFQFSVEAEAEHSGNPNAIRSGIASEIIGHLANAVQSKQKSE